MKKICCAALLLLPSACQKPPMERPALVRTGQPAPELRLKKLLNAPLPELKGWTELAGKAAVIEFWATWCEPCVDNIPHFNELAEKFKDKPVVFISVTDESEADVRAFLADHKLGGWIAPEAGAEVFKAFRVYGRPYTVLVGPDGNVSALTYPSEVTEAVVERLISGGPAETGALAPATDVLAEFYIAEAKGGGGTAQYGPDFMSAAGMPLEYALESVFGRVDELDVAPAAKTAMAASYDIRLRLPPGRAELKREFFLNGLETALGLKIKETVREAEVYILKAAPGGPVNVKPAAAFGGSKYAGAEFNVSGASFGVLASALKARLKEPVLDETGAAGPFSYSFDFSSSDPKGMNVQLRKQLGLKLERKLRKLRTLRVTGAR